MKKISCFILLAIFATALLTSCMENYSQGERVGFVNKFSKKGVAWDSWEGELNLTQTGMNSSSLWNFSIDNDVNDETVIALLDSAVVQGWKVKLTYHEVTGKNWFSNRGETDCFVTAVTVLDRTPIGSNDNFMQTTIKDTIRLSDYQLRKVPDTIYVVVYKDIHELSPPRK